jgi:hypothetical protein
MDLSESAKEARRAYMIAWRNAHPEYVASQKKYTKEWRKANPERVAKYSASYWERRALINTQQEEKSTS